jgi:glycosyltransferase involved in cell wall biosynthesis
MKVLLIAPNIDALDVGEAFVAYKWADVLSGLVDLTVLSFQRGGRPDLKLQLPNARVVTWPEPEWAQKHERLNAMLKPAWPVFARRVKKWMRKAQRDGHHFDIAHQLMPQAARYPSPLRHFDTPYIIGPLGGALDTPSEFLEEASSAPLFTRLRAMDRFRFKYDPWLRASYSKAACILGVAPYAKDVLGDVPLQRFEPVLELGIDNVALPGARSVKRGKIKVLHVGRGVRTKGLRDTVRAIALLKDLPDVHLTSAGAGEEIDICKAEADRLGVSDRVTFLGKVPRDHVEHLYASHDVFCFPSFREPAGGVLYEAMRHGLPVVTCDRGGPAWIVDETSGFKIPVSDTRTFAHDIAKALRQLALSPELRRAIGDGARTKVAKEGLWPNKAEKLVDLYKDIVGDRKTGSVIRKDSHCILC